MPETCISTAERETQESSPGPLFLQTQESWSPAPSSPSTQEVWAAAPCPEGVSAGLPAAPLPLGGASESPTPLACQVGEKTSPSQGPGCWPQGPHPASSHLCAPPAVRPAAHHLHSTLRSLGRSDAFILRVTGGGSRKPGLGWGWSRGPHWHPRGLRPRGRLASPSSVRGKRGRSLRSAPP